MTASVYPGKSSILGLGLLVILCCVPPVRAAAPSTITIQGKLAGAAGRPLPGLRAWRVQFYDAPQGGAPLGAALLGSVEVSSSGRFVIEAAPPPQALAAPDSVYYELAIDSNVPPNGLGPADVFPGRVRIGSVLHALLARNASAATTATNSLFLDGRDESFFRHAGNLATGTLDPARYSAYEDLGAEGYLDNTAANDLLTRQQGDDRFWRLGGNAGITSTTDFLGTRDVTPLDLRVNGVSALRLVPPLSFSQYPSIIGGYRGNWVRDNDVYGAFIGGGGKVNRVNRVTDDYGVIAGGTDNQAGNDNGSLNDRACATVGGGEGNIAAGSYSSVAGGQDNVTTGSCSAIGGGNANAIRGAYATVPGGAGNFAEANYSLAAGRGSVAAHLGSFVWSDSSTASGVASQRDYQFRARALGGVRFDINNNAWLELYEYGTDTLAVSNGAHLTRGGAWTNASDRAAKENFRPVNGRAVLDRLMATTVTTWNYKAEPRSVRHMGPVAQDFRAAFGLGDGDRSIGTVDADGVALVSIQALGHKVEALEARNKLLETQNRALEARLRALEKKLER